MDTLTFRPKRDRRSQPRIAPMDIADRALERHRRGEERGQGVNEADRKPGEGDAEQNES